MGKQYHQSIQDLKDDGWTIVSNNGHYLILKKDKGRIKVALKTGTIISKKEIAVKQ